MRKIEDADYLLSNNYIKTQFTFNLETISYNILEGIDVTLLRLRSHLAERFIMIINVR